MFIRSWIHRLFARPGFGTVSGPLRPSWDFLSALTAPQNLQVEQSGEDWIFTWEPPASNGGFPVTNYSAVVLVNGLPEAGSGSLGNVLTWTYDFPEFQNQEITVVVICNNGVVQSPYSNGVTLTPGAVTTTTTTTPEPSGTMLEDTFTGSGDFNVHEPEVGSWNIGGGFILTGDGRLEFPQSMGANLNSSNLTLGQFDATLQMQFDSGFLNSVVIDFNYDPDTVVTEWKLVVSGASVILQEVTDFSPTVRGSYSFPGGTTSATIRLNTEADGGDTVNVYVNGVLRITYTDVGRLGKDNTTFAITSDLTAYAFYLTYVKVTQIP
jgi:hypothetical protein